MVQYMHQSSLTLHFWNHDSISIEDTELMLKPFKSGSAHNMQPFYEQSAKK